MEREGFVSFAAKLVTPGVEPDEGLLGPAPPSACPPADPLTDALLFLAAYHGRALSRTALLTGLPITDGKLSVHLFERAAQRAGLEVQAVKRSIWEIPALVLPVFCWSIRKTPDWQRSSVPPQQRTRSLNHLAMTRPNISVTRSSRVLPLRPTHAPLLRVICPKCIGSGQRFNAFGQTTCTSLSRLLL